MKPGEKKRKTVLSREREKEKDECLGGNVMDIGERNEARVGRKVG